MSGPDYATNDDLAEVESTVMTRLDVQDQRLDAVTEDLRELADRLMQGICVIARGADKILDPEKYR